MHLSRKLNPVWVMRGVFCRKFFLVTGINLTLILLTILSHAQTQKITISGTVTDSLGVIIPGATLAVVNDTKVQTQTDQNGRYILDVSPGVMIRISNLGYQEKRVTVPMETKVLNIVLQEANIQVEEVVITAFNQKQRKEAVVGSVTSVKPAELKIPSSNLTNALAGQIAGVIGFQRSGQPGQDNAQFFIRGVTTFGYRVDPLILIDNVELTTSDLARLQVDDIESFTILKDASATALYGARGANGVILVNTKEGKEGKSRINLRLENSTSQSAKTLALADPITYMNLYNEAAIGRNPLTAVPFDPNKIINTQATLDNAPGSNPYVYPAVDWLDLLFKDKTSTRRANMSVSGGGGVARYYVAGSYNLDNGILREDIRNNNNNNVKFQNYQLRSNVNINLSKTTEMIVRLSGSFNEYNGPLTADGGFSTDMYKIAMHTSPVLFPAYYEPDFANTNTKHILFGNIGNSGSNDIQYMNPYALLLRGHKNSSESRMSAQLELNQNLNFLTEGLNFRGIFNTNRYSYFDSQLSYNPFYYNIGAYDRVSGEYVLDWLNPQPTGNNVATEYLNYAPGEPNLNTFLYFQGAANYNRDFGPHTVSATLIGTMQQTLYSNRKDPRTKTVTLQYSLPYRNIGAAGRLTYSYKSRYFIEGNFGYNGSERFSESHRFGFFPTIGASWMLSNEPFWKGIGSVVDRLKLRGSYGLVGNDAIGDQRFFYLSDVELNGGGNYAWFGTGNYQRNGVFIRNYENPDITWETSKQTNLAIEATLFKDLEIIAEVYRQQRYNILMQRENVPTSMGLESGIFANIGKAQSKGIDLQMNYRKSFENGFLGVRSNFTFAKNKFDYFEEPQWAESYRYRRGQPINRRWGYIAERLFVDDREAMNSPTQLFNGLPPKGGDIKYRDLNNDGKIDGADMAFIGYPEVPEIVAGFGFSAGYKGFDLSAFFQAQARVSLFIDPSRISPFVQPHPDDHLGNGNTQLLQQWADSHWSEENQDLYALYPRMGVNRNDIANNIQTSTWWMRDGSFLRLKSLEIGYTLPKSITERMKLSNCRIYLNGLNLLTFSHFDYWDPEQGGNAFNYPIQKVFNVGININL